MKLKLAAGLVGIVACRPYVARVGKDGAVQFPEQECAILEAEIELQVSRLVDKVDLSVVAPVLPGAEPAYLPAAHRVGAACEITLLVGDYRGIAVGQGYAEVRVERHGVAFVDDKVFDKIEVGLGVLGKGDVKELVVAVGVARGMKEFGDEIQQIARGLEREFHAVSGGVCPRSTA